MPTPFANGGAPRYRVIEEARVVEHLLAQGWLHELRHGDAARAGVEARAALDHWVALGLPFATAADGTRRFDIAELVGFIIWSARHLADPIWEDRFVATGRRLVLGMHPGVALATAPPSPTSLAPKQFRMTLRRTFNLAFRAPSSRIRLRLPLPIGGGGITGLRITPLPPPAALEAQCCISPGRLDVIVNEPASRHITLGAQVAFVSDPTIRSGAGQHLSPGEYSLYTRPAEGVVQVTERIAAVAARLSGTAQDDAARVERFWRFLQENLVCGGIRYDQVPPVGPLDWLLDFGWFDCHLGAALIVALCRARGIPARLCSGYFLYPLAPAHHYWFEVWLPPRGWLPFDLTSWGLSSGGRDAAWRDYFFGRIDHRCQTECLPRLFTGLHSLKLPAAWQMLQRPLADGVEVGMWSDDTGEFVFTDRMRIDHQG